MSNLPDLLTRPAFAARPHGESFGYVTVEATNQRGRDFLRAYLQATSDESGDDEVGEVDYLPFLPEELKQFERQASLAACSMGEAEDYPDYDPFA
jgi:hypothetical protein